MSAEVQPKPKVTGYLPNDTQPIGSMLSKLYEHNQRCQKSII